VVEAVAPDADEDEQALVGRHTGLSFAVDDIQAAQQSMAARGVPFASTPERQAWGGWTTSFEDPDGNALQLVQHPTA
jgi:predicted enzyme related to lactoylglutathione lyase